MIIMNHVTVGLRQFNMYCQLCMILYYLYYILFILFVWTHFHGCGPCVLFTNGVSMIGPYFLIVSEEVTSE